MIKMCTFCGSTALMGLPSNIYEIRHFGQYFCQPCRDKTYARIYTKDMLINTDPLATNFITYLDTRSRPTKSYDTDHFKTDPVLENTRKICKGQLSCPNREWWLQKPRLIARINSLCKTYKSYVLRGAPNAIEKLSLEKFVEELNPDTLTFMLMEECERRLRSPNKSKYHKFV